MKTPRISPSDKRNLLIGLKALGLAATAWGLVYPGLLWGLDRLLSA
ncbi:hypothetical protein [Paucibacter sp. KBW04]|nr:hypothetical protein [Paucibacter sp. KBW04]